MSDSERQPLLRSRTYLVPVGKCHYFPGAIVLFLVFLERLAFYSLTSNFYLFLNQSLFDWTAYNSMNALLLFMGITYISCLVGGLIADSALGRFNTIALGLVLFAGSYLILPFLYSFPESFCSNVTHKLLNYSETADAAAKKVPLFSEPCSSWLLPIMMVAAFGAGSASSNLVPFGIKQVHYRGPEYMRVYLNWFYWCVNLGGLIAVLAIGYVQQNVDFFSGYLAPAAVIAFASVLFICGRPLYNIPQNTGNAYMRIFRIIKEACKSNRRFQANQDHLGSDQAPRISPSWLDMAKVQYGGKFHEAAVEDVKSLGTIIVVFIFLIPYWILYFQMQTTFLNQGLHMRLGLNMFNSSCNSEEQKFVIPASWLTIFDILFLFLFIPLMDWVIYPWFDRKGWHIPLLSQMHIGMFIASLSMLSAGILEIFRRESAQSNSVCQVIDRTTFMASEITVFWQIPQYMFMGMSEVFTSITGMEFAASQAPSSMQGVIMGLFYFFTGIGSFIGSLIIIVSQDVTWIHFNWDIGNINSSHLEYYFFFLCGLQLLSLLVFGFVSSRLKIRRPPRQAPRLYFHISSAASSGSLDQR